MAKAQVSEITIMNDSGLPLLVYNAQEGKVDMEALSAGGTSMRSSLLVAAIQALAKGEKLSSFVSLEGKKHLLLKKENIIINVTFTGDVDEYTENAYIFAYAVLHAILRIHEYTNLLIDFVDVNEYVNTVGPIFQKFVSKLMQRLELK
ncbi:MAG: hypothetical protein Q6351_010420 [Candidatus Njordarchaeum guaymaensis]